MANNRIAEYLKYANFQMAAEAFLQGFIVTNSDPTPGVSNTYIAALTLGNNHASKFPDILAAQFSREWEIVDSQPNTGRHSFADVPLYAVIDHHTTPGDLEDVAFVDVRPTLGATCTMATRYLIEQDVSLPPRVATALLYGIETEVSGYPREATPMDDGAMQFLFPLANRDILAQIRNARLPHSHFEVLLQALQSSFIHDRLIVSWVSNLPQPEQAAEVVDFMVRFEKVDWALCGGVCGNRLVLSLRTSLHGVQAGDFLRQVVGELGKAGGHDRRAGGYVTLADSSPKVLEEAQAELLRRTLKALRCDNSQGQRLVPLREMLQNIQG